MKITGKDLKRLRKENRVSQEALAERLQIRKLQVSRWENEHVPLNNIRIYATLVAIGEQKLVSKIMKEIKGLAPSPRVNPEG